MTLPGTAATGFALLSAVLLGLRHGLDYDHVAAISDISAVETQPRRAMKLGLFYAVGHGIMVAALGVSAILFQASLPTRVDGRMGQVVGVTLLGLGGYVLYADFFRRHQRDSIGVRSRAMLVVGSVLWVAWRIRQSIANRPLPRPALLPGSLGSGSAIGLGVIHGIGAETPTQLMIFLLAANLGGPREGLFGLAFFLAGLFTTNALMCVASAGIIRVAGMDTRGFRWIVNASAAYSMAVGGVLLTVPLLH